MIVKPPTRLDSRLEIPIACSVLFGSDLRRKGSILSMAATVAIDSVPSMRVTVMTMSRTSSHKSGLSKDPLKVRKTKALVQDIGRYRGSGSSV